MKRRKPRCRWCGERLDSRGHQEITEGLCFVLNEKEIRSRTRPRVKRLSEVYNDEGRLRSEFLGTDMEDKLMARQRSLAIDAILGLGQNGYKVPRNIGHFVDQGFVHGQVAHRRPWAVYVLVGGRRKRKRFNNLYEAVEFHRKVSKKYPSSGVVSMSRSYELPREFRIKKNKYPKKFKWCPYCGDFRVYKRRVPEETFFAQVKFWSDEKGRFIWAVRKLWLTECQLCGNTNRSPIFRRANQPWEVRRIKRGVKRVKPRIRTKRGRLARQKKRAIRRVR